MIITLMCLIILSFGHKFKCVGLSPQPDLDIVLANKFTFIEIMYGTKFVEARTKQNDFLWVCNV